MRRLHPSSPLFWLAKLTYQMIYPAIGALAWSRYQSQWVIYALLVAIVVGALWQYVFSTMPCKKITWWLPKA
jgi:hypothetical protein